MKVRCVRQFDARGNPIEKSSWLTIGKTYDVLEIHVSGNSGIKFHLVGDDKRTPAYHPWTQFEIVSSNIPTCWVVSFQVGSHLTVGPCAWTVHGFWERYFDGDEEARKVFDDVHRAIVAEEL